MVLGKEDSTVFKFKNLSIQRYGKRIQVYDAEKPLRVTFGRYN
jgi:hypothetical protein